MEVNVETFQVNDFGTNTTVKLNLIHNILSMQIPEVRFDLFQKIESVKVLFKFVMFLKKNFSPYVQKSLDQNHCLCNYIYKTRVSKLLFIFLI